LLKTLANAEGAVLESIKARRDLISGLEKLLETNRAALQSEETQYEDLAEKRTTAEVKKREVEDEILRKLPSEEAGSGGLGGDDEHLNGNGGVENEDLERPQMEELTPPPVEFDAPVGSPGAGSDAFGATPAGGVAPPSVATPGLASTRALSGSPSDGAAPKKRKIEIEQHQELLPGDAMADLDDDVAALLRAESGQK
jgi:regulator of Ty1 transposition protein 103